MYDKILFNDKKEGNPAVCDNLNETWERSAKWNKSEKDEYYMILFICGI